MSDDEVSNFFHQLATWHGAAGHESFDYNCKQIMMQLVTDGSRQYFVWQTT
jgi:hypothetical protein